LNQFDAAYPVVRAGWILQDALDYSTITKENSLFAERAILLNQWASSNYGHYLLEVLPKPAFASTFVNLVDYIFLINRRVTGSMERVYKDTLTRGGYANPLVPCTKPTRVRDLIFVTTPGRHGFSKYPPNVDYARSLYVPNHGPYGKRIWLDRTPGLKRSLTNRTELLQLALTKGFEVIDAAEMPVAQQAAAINSAELILGPVGAAFSNVIFANRNAHCITLCPSELRETFFYDCASVLGLNYTYIVGKAQNPDLRYNSNYQVDPADLQQFLDFL
jgi:capsular polysaccharide biosynthesis protein